MEFQRQTAQEHFWRLTLRQMLAVMALFAVGCAVWMYRLRGPSAQETQWRQVLAAEEAVRSALMESVLADDRQAVERLIEAGADPNALASYANGYDSVLQVAITSGSLQSVRALAAAGADVNKGRPLLPLESVVRANIPFDVKTEMVRVLIEHGADLKRGEGAMDAALEIDAVEIVTLLRQAGAVYGPREMALAGNIGELRAALKRNPQLLERPLDEFYWGCKSLLGIALMRGHEELAVWLLDNGASLEMHEVNHQSALHIAALGDCSKLIPRLQAAGCDVRDVDDAGDTPLLDATSRASPQTIAALIEAGADVQKSSHDRQTPLHRAVIRYERTRSGAALEIISLLLSAGADPDAADATGQTPRKLVSETSRAVLSLLESR